MTSYGFSLFFARSMIVDAQIGMTNAQTQVRRREMHGVNQEDETTRQNRM